MAGTRRSAPASLKDADGGKAFIERIIATAAEMAFCFAYEPDEKVIDALERMRGSLQKDFAHALGAEMSGGVGDKFIAIVMDEKHRIEAPATSTRRR